MWIFIYNFIKNDYITYNKFIIIYVYILLNNSSAPLRPWVKPGTKNASAVAVPATNLWSALLSMNVMARPIVRVISRSYLLPVALDALNL